MIRFARPVISLPPLEGARVVDEIECVVSVLLAIVLAHQVGAENISWAAFSGYMVMRGHIADSLLRGSLRVIGTGLGVGLAVLIVPTVIHSLALSALACAVIGGATLYGALTSQRSYGWFFVGLTFLMILLDKLEAPHHSIAVFAETRVLEVVSGTLSCLLVSALSNLTARRRWPGKRMARAKSVGWHPHALRHAGQGAVALAVLPLLGSFGGLAQLGQGAISIMAVMLVPVSSIGLSGFRPVSRRLFLRVAGCLAGAVLSAAVLYAAHGSALLLIVGTVIGVAIGKHIENGSHGFAYVGTQFTLAVLVTLVPDSYAGAAITPAFDRLYGILIGMAVLEPVLVAWHVIRPGALPMTASSPSEAME